MKTFAESGYEFSPFGPPRSKGVYVVCLCRIKSKGGYGKPKAAYIGSAINIYARVMALTHPYRLLFDQANNKYVVCLAYKETPYYLSEEIRMIRKYSPKYNVMHKATGI